MIGLIGSCDARLQNMMFVSRNLMMHLLNAQHGLQTTHILMQHVKQYLVSLLLGRQGLI